MSARIVIFVALLAYAGVANAETVSWGLPTHNADGSVIPATGDAALKETEIQVGDCTSVGTFGTVQRTLKAAAPATSLEWPSPDIGAYCLRGRVSNNAGVSSAWSQVVAYTKTAPKPGRINISITATVPP